MPSNKQFVALSFIHFNYILKLMTARSRTAKEKSSRCVLKQLKKYPGHSLKIRNKNSFVESTNHYFLASAAVSRHPVRGSGAARVEAAERVCVVVAVAGSARQNHRRVAPFSRHPRLLVAVFVVAAVVVVVVVITAASAE